MVRTEDGDVIELSQLSLTTEALVKGNYQTHWLVFPSEVAEKLSSIRELVPSGK
jgi:hypothetical protein